MITVLIAKPIYHKESTRAEIQKGITKLLSFGTTFLANPNLLKHFELDTGLTKLVEIQ